MQCVYIGICSTTNSNNFHCIRNVIIIEQCCRQASEIDSNAFQLILNNNKPVGDWFARS